MWLLEIRLEDGDGWMGWDGITSGMVLVRIASSLSFQHTAWRILSSCTWVDIFVDVDLSVDCKSYFAKLLYPSVLNDIEDQKCRVLRWLDGQDSKAVQAHSKVLRFYTFLKVVLLFRVDLLDILVFHLSGEGSNSHTPEANMPNSEWVLPFSESNQSLLFKRSPYVYWNQ